MSDDLIGAVTGIAIAVIGVAIVAILVSQQSDTSNVLGAGGQTFADMLACAMSPVTGKPCRGGQSSIGIKLPPIGVPRGGSNSTITYGDIGGYPSGPAESGG